MGGWLLVWGPLTASLLFVALLFRGRVNDAPIALCDLDHSPLSRQLIHQIEASPTLRIDPPVTSPEEGRRLILEGKVWAVVVIPEGFGSSLLTARQARVESYIPGTNLSMNGLIKRDLQQIISTFEGGVALQRLTMQGMAPSEARKQVEPLRMVVHPLFNPTLDYGIYLAPGFMMMVLLLFLLLATITTLGIELRQGSGRACWEAAEESPTRLLAGKLLPIGCIFFGWAQWLLLLMWGVLKVPFRGSLLLLEGGIILLILAYQAVGSLLVIWSANLRLSLSLGGGYGVMAFSFSGLTFPRMAMWPLMQGMAHLFPFTPFADLLMDQTLRGAPVAEGWGALGQMALFLLLFLPAGWRVGRVMSNEKYWYRR